MKTSALLPALAVAALLPFRADAQEVRLQIQDGLVTLDAQNVSVRQILAEWARVGGAQIVNGEKVMGGPVTLHLSATPERQALDTILRGVSGYMLATRQAPGAGSSAFDRILIMPTSSAPRASATPASNAPFTPRPMPMPQQQPVADPTEAEAEAVADDDYDVQDAGDPEGPIGAEEEADAPPPGNLPFQRRPQMFPNPMGQQGQPFTPPQFPGIAQPGAQGATQPGQPNTAPMQVPPGATATPGVISPVPQQPDDEQPPNPRTRRPPL